MVNKICRLCESDSQLQVSHIIPKFIYDWHKKTSVTGRIRMTPEVNKPVQDGLKLPWLCEACEIRLSKYETYFADKIFYPLVSTTSRVSYDENMLKACVSISWRVAKYFHECGHLDHYPEDIKAAIAKAISSWREFILDERSNPGEFEQHIFNFNGEISGESISSPNIHRYLQRTIDINVIYTSKVALTYVVIPNFLLIGYIKCGSLAKWRATRIHVKKGTLQPLRYKFPKELFTFIVSRSELAMSHKKSISDRQQNKINTIYQNKSENVAQSQSWRSLTRDIELFGEDEVFGKNKDD